MLELSSFLYSECQVINLIKVTILQLIRIEFS